MKKNMNRNLKQVLSVAMLMSILVVDVSANNLLESDLAQGALSLFDDILTFLMIVCPVAGGIAWGLFMGRKTIATEQDGLILQKRANTALICGVAGLFGPALIKLFSSYFT